MIMYGFIELQMKQLKQMLLCHHCNFVKGIKRNNHTCPHKIMRKEESFARMNEQNSFEILNLQESLLEH